MISPPQSMFFGTVLLIALVMPPGEALAQQAGDDSPSRLSDQPIPLIDEDQIRPNPPLIQFGPGLLTTGEMETGFTLPTGAIWRPSLWIYGSFRSGINSVDPAPGGGRILELANRLDLFANLQLSGTERILIGMQPLQDEGRFSRYVWHPTSDEGWTTESSSKLTTFFFEGEIGEIFPGLDPTDHLPLDIGFSVGRWGIDLQDGMLVNDKMDAIGLTKFFPVPGTSTTRFTLFYGWDELHRDDNVLTEETRLYGISTEADTLQHTIEADLVYIRSPESEGGSGIYAGLGSQQRIKAFGRVFNSTVRLLNSHALDQSNAQVSNGTLFFTEVSTSPFGTRDNAYLTTFLGFGEFSSAARGPTKGGPLGKAGLLFAAPGLGRFKPALGNRADNSVGGAIGYQWMLENDMRQVVVEAGGRAPLEGDGISSIAAGLRYQQKIYNNLMIQVDGYSRRNGGDDWGEGIRAEFVVKF
jgi:hypothetical protein